MEVLLLEATVVVPVLPGAEPAVLELGTGVVAATVVELHTALSASTDRAHLATEVSPWANKSKQ